MFAAGISRSVYFGGNRRRELKIKTMPNVIVVNAGEKDVTRPVHCMLASGNCALLAAWGFLAFVAQAKASPNRGRRLSTTVITGLCVT